MGLLTRFASSTVLLMVCTMCLDEAILPANADEFEDIVDLSLEDLAEISLASTIALGLHHTHPKGEWMFGYSYMPMAMDGNRSGTDELSVDAVFNQGFLIAPTRMDMDMHMFETMYGISDDLTLMVMLPYKKLSMDHVTAGGASFTTESDGIGDASLTGLYTFFRHYPHRMHLSVGLSIPTGSIDERGATPMGPNLKLPYPMQLGSGTYDPVLSVTYLGTAGRLSWGAYAGGIVRSGKNDVGYTLGNRYEIDGWLARKWNDSLSSFLRLDVIHNCNIDGADPELNPMMVPTANPGLRSGDRINLRLGTSMYMPGGVLKGSRVGIELGVPIHQSLNGPQLQSEWAVNLAFQWVR